MSDFDEGIIGDSMLLLPEPRLFLFSFIITSESEHAEGRPMTAQGNPKQGNNSPISVHPYDITPSLYQYFITSHLA